MPKYEVLINRQDSIRVIVKADNPGDAERDALNTPDDAKNFHVFDSDQIICQTTKL